MFRWLKSAWARRSLSEADFQRERCKILATAPIPVIWLFGKTGGGKSSIVRYLTGAEDAEIGNGFQPKTATSCSYDFPSPDQPVLRFLDTRGVAEGTYDPSEDIRQFHAAAHVMIVTVRIADYSLEHVIGPLTRFRQAQPLRPVVLALTCLHDLYAGHPHPDPDPFVEGENAARIPVDVRRAMERHQQSFAGLVDRVVPIDFTQPEDGFSDVAFGGQRLKQTIVELLPAAYRQTFLNLNASMTTLQNLSDRRMLPYVVGYSTLAAAAAAVPTPWVDIPIVIAIQSHLIYRLRSLYGLHIDWAVLRRLGGVVSARLATALLVREALKLVPVVGSAVNAAAAYAYTYGLGVACCWYLGQVRAGNAPTDEEVKTVWRQQLTLAASVWNVRGRATGNSTGPQQPQLPETPPAPRSGETPREPES